MGLVHEIDYGTPESKSEKQVTLTIDGFEVTVPEGTSVDVLVSDVLDSVKQLHRNGDQYFTVLCFAVY